jgi:hypothetical protein
MAGIICSITFSEQKRLARDTADSVPVAGADAPHKRSGRARTDGHWKPAAREWPPSFGTKRRLPYRRGADSLTTNEDMAIENPNYWRARAEEARRRSEQVDDSIAKALMLQTADSYERIAKAYERMVIIRQPGGR